MILSVCHKHGLHPQGKCPSCTKADNRRRNTKPKRRQWKTKDYQAARALTLARTGHCELQLPGCTGKATSVDHQDYGLNDAQKWKAACAHCHGSIDRRRYLARAS